MSSSAQLRQSHTKFGGGATINSEVAKNFESNLKNIQEPLLQKLRENYTDTQFEVKNRLVQKELHESLGVSMLGGYYENKVFIKPDGGMILADGIPIYIGEAKKQGTNIERALEGLPPQSKGNAIERAFKNLEEIKILMENQSHFPYVLFAFGCDFNKGSSIRSRLLPATRYFEFNKIYVDKEGMPARASVFINSTGFTEEEMLTISYKVCEESLRCISKNK